MASDLPNLVVIVEGGPRAIKKFSRLMLRRIDWSSKAKARTKAAKTNEDGNHSEGMDLDNDNNE